MRDYLFQICLFLAALVISELGRHAEWKTRLGCWIFAGVLVIAATVSYFFGDPVRGPFYGLHRHTDNDEFRFHAGGLIKGFPIKALSEGISLSDIVDFGGTRPIALVVSHTWWRGWSYEVDMKISHVDTADRIHISNNTIRGLPGGWDFNSDEDAVEVVDKNGIPIFQLVWVLDYEIYVNTIVHGRDGYTILNGDDLYENVDERMASQYRLTPIFKYPGYANKGKRI